jgi:hypothetical protein
VKRDELEHVLRAAGAITGVSTWVIVGSQAILGALPDAPAELLVSQEVDFYLLHRSVTREEIETRLCELDDELARRIAS